MGSIAIIEELLARIQDAWNRGDFVAYAQCYAEDATYLSRAGTLLVGRGEIENLHCKALGETLKGSHLRSSLRHVAWLAESIAVVHVDIEIRATTPVWAVSTFVIRDGLIVAAQTTEL